MPRATDADIYEQLEEIAPPVRMRHIAQPRTVKMVPRSRSGHHADGTRKPGMEEESGFQFSYHASKYERAWMGETLEAFHDAHWIDDVLYLVKGGKEATVYQCAANPSAGTDFLAAKVYRPRRFRSLKNDHVYQEGRLLLDSSGNEITEDGMLQAIRDRSNYGLDLLHNSWIEHEYKALDDLYAAGADVPRPFARGDEHSPPPTLNTIELDAVEARQLFQRVLHNIELILRSGRIHADLSAFNILYQDGKITLIDFPQVVAPDQNPSALRIFRRDVKRICEYFNGQGVHADADSISTRLWTTYHHLLAPAADVKYLDPEDAGDRQYWETSQRD